MLTEGTPYNNNIYGIFQYYELLMIEPPACRQNKIHLFVFTGFLFHRKTLGLARIGTDPARRWRISLFYGGN